MKLHPILSIAIAVLCLASAPGRSAESDAAAGQRGKTGGGANAVQERFNQMAKQLGLSAEQKARLLQMQGEEYQKTGGLGSQGEMTPQQQMERYQKFREGLEQRLKQSKLLSDEQFAKWKEFQSRSHSGGGAGRSQPRTSPTSSTPSLPEAPKTTSSATNAAAAADGHSGKRILIYCPPQGHNDVYVPWLMFDPIIVAETAISVEVKEIPRGRCQPDLSAKTLDGRDLVIVTMPHDIAPEQFADLLRFLDQGGTLFLFQPRFESAEFAAELAKRTGVRLKGWSEATPVSAVVAEHPGARILGLHRGRSAYPIYKNTTPYQRKPVPGFVDMDAGSSPVLTRLVPGGQPDLTVASNGRLAVFASDVLGSVSFPGPGKQGVGMSVDYYSDIERNDHRRFVSLLIINTTRRLLGYPFFEQPLQQPHQRLGEMFHAYAAGRDFVLEVHQQPGLGSRLPASQLAETLRKSDGLVGAAARAGVAGDLDTCRQHFKEAVQLLSTSMRTMTPVNHFMYRAWHASKQVDENYGGGIWGDTENGWMDEMVRWCTEEIDFLRWAGGRRLIEFYGSELEMLKKYYPEEMKNWSRAVADGLVEPTHGLFSASYLDLWSGECNVRQLLYGTRAVRDVLGSKVNAFVTPDDHFDYHPQLPQLLRGFGYEGAILRQTYLGDVQPVAADRIRWRGLDGTEIDAIPEPKGVMGGIQRLYVTPKLMALADQKGYKNLVTGLVYDTGGGDTTFERAHTILNAIAPVSGKWVTSKEIFEQIPPGKESICFDADGLTSSHVQSWSRWGLMNEAIGRNRTAENQIMSAEKLLVLGQALGRVAPDQQAEASSRLVMAWKDILAVQDHMLFGHLGGGQKKKTDAGTVMPYSVQPPGFENDLLAAPRFDRAVNVNEITYQKGLASSARVLNDAIRMVVQPGSAADAQAGQLPMAITVFNPLSWPKQDFVEVETELAADVVAGMQVIDGDRSVPFQVVAGGATDQKEGKKAVKILFEAHVPALSWKSLILKAATAAPAKAAKGSLSVSSTKLENEFYLVELDEKNGAVRRIHDKQLQRDVLAAGEYFGNELYSPTNPTATSKSGTARLEVVESGPLRGTVKVNSQVDKIGYECKISLLQGAKRVDFVLTFNGRENFGGSQQWTSRNTTGLFVVFPVGTPEHVWVNQPFGIYETRLKDQLANDFIEAGQAGHGLAVIHRQTPSWRIDGGLLWMRLCEKDSPMGRYTYSIYSHAGDVHQGQVFRVAQSVNTPFVVHQGTVPASLPAKASPAMLTIDQPNIVLSGLYSEGDSLMARFYEIAGRKTPVAISSPIFTGQTCQRVELDGRPLAAVPVSGESLQIELKPWEIVTLKLDGKK
jgi:hypothetical protein